MEQHPIPQNITGFQFKLIGDMTIKQFLFLGGGILAGYLITLLPWIFIIKWAIAVSVGFFGIALAFMPLEERPLDRWLIAFFRAVYSPTQYIWRKKPPVLDFLSYSTATPLPVVKEETILTQPTAKLKEYLKTLPYYPKAPIDEKEELALKNLGFSFGNSPSEGAFLAPFPPSDKDQKDSLPQVRIHKLKTPIAGEIVISDVAKNPPPPPSYPQPSLTINPPPKPKPEIPIIKENPLSTFKTPPEIDLNSNIKIFPDNPQSSLIREVNDETRKDKDEIRQNKKENENLGRELLEKQKEIELLKKQIGDTSLGKTRLSEMLDNYSQAQKQKEEALIKIEGLERKLAQSGNKPVTPREKEAVKESSPNVHFTADNPAKKQGAQTSSGNPNVLTGTVIDKTGGVIPDVIITVKDYEGIPVRAVKTNKVGQFKTTTPLVNGQYTVELEKDGFEFDIISLEAKGEIISPLEIKAK